MAASSRAVTVTTTATRLDSTTDDADGPFGQGLAIYNNGSATIYLGGSDVTTANGSPVPAGTWGPGFEMHQQDELYAIVASGTVEVRVLEVGID
jgi:hypothetical protein